MPLLTISIIFVIWLAYEIKKHNSISEHEMKDFWTRERTANSTRRKSLDDLDYIRIPLSDLPISENLPTQENLPIQADIKQDRIRECQEKILLLADKKILNLTGYSNTDLKLQYGAPNITQLTAYDQNYTTLVSTLASWGELLLNNGQLAEGRTVLEFGISCNTDVSKNYLLLGKLYAGDGNYSAIHGLILQAESLNSLTKKYIVDSLQELIPS